MTKFRPVFVALAIVWATALPAAAFVAGRPWSELSSVSHAFALVVYDIGRVICHQRPERSFHLLGAQWAVCARCAGIYAGAAIAAALLAAAAPFTLRTSLFKLERPDFKLVLLVAVLPGAATLIYEWTTGQAPGNWIRAASGAPIGAAVAWTVSAVR